MLRFIVFGVVHYIKKNTKIRPFGEGVGIYEYIYIYIYADELVLGMRSPVIKPV